MTDTTRITGRPELPSQPGGTSPAPQVFARVPGGGPIGAAPDARLQGLIQGLQAFSPALREWKQRQDAEDHQAAIDQAKAQAETVEKPVDALTGGPVDVPSSVPPAFGSEFRRTYGETLAQRAALQTRQEIASAYEDQKNAPDFDVNAFLQQQRQKALQGIQDPLLQGVTGAHLDEVEAGIRHDFQALTVKRVDQQRVSAAYQLADGMTGDKSPQQLGQMYHDFYEPRVGELQVDKAQAASLFLQRLQKLSDAGNGRPELFDAMEAQDSSGLSVLARNPQLQSAVLEAKQHATTMRDRKLHEDTEVARFAELAAFDDDIQNRPETVTLDRVQHAIGPNGLSAEQGASLINRAQLSLAKRAMVQSRDDLASRGQLGMLGEGEQREYMEPRLAGGVQRLWDAATSGDAQGATFAASQLMQAQSRMGATVPVEGLRNLIKTSVSTLPNPQGPSAAFKASAAVYEAMAANPQYRNMYFDESSSKVMDAWLAHKDGADEKTAYDAAYRTIDPAVAAAARKRLDDPTFQARLQSVTKDAAQGSSFLARWLGGNGRPVNLVDMGGWASLAARKALMDNPDATDSEVAAYVEREAARNWVVDSTSNRAIKVRPDAQGNVREAFAEFSKDTLEAHKELPSGSHIEYIPRDDRGSYMVRAMNGMDGRTLGDITLQQLVLRNAQKHTMTAAEGDQVWKYKHALETGAPLPDLDPSLLGRAVSIGYLKDDELQAMQQRNGQRILERLRQTPDMGLGKPSGNYTELPRRGSVPVDNQLTSQTALELFGASVPQSAFLPAQTDQTTAAASSLVAMREGISLRAYQDPAKDGGTNIGAGYNLKAHAADADGDLKASGVPVEDIQAVKTGSKQLTSDQAKRLLQVSIGRYTQQTKEVADKAAPGLWDRMMPAQRAVMIDLAYQTGNAGQFHKAWEALQRGDTAGFKQEAKTFYKNQAGQMVEDARGTELRAAMLAGASYWKARLQLAGGRPSNSLQAAQQLAQGTAGGQ